MIELVRRHPVAVALAALVAVGIAGWLFWASFMHTGSADLPPGAPAAGGRVPGPMGGVTPGAPSGPGTLPGTSGR